MGFSQYPIKGLNVAYMIFIDDKGHMYFSIETDLNTFQRLVSVFLIYKVYQ
jgi:sensor domain CHASE-containing protein